MSIWQQQKALNQLEDRLTALEVMNDDLRRTIKSLNLEYIELYDKVSHQMSRMAKRYARAKVNGDTPPEDVPAPEHEDGLDPISRSILARRGLRSQPK